MIGFVFSDMVSWMDNIQFYKYLPIGCSKPESIVYSPHMHMLHNVSKHVIIDRYVTDEYMANIQ